MTQPFRIGDGFGVDSARPVSFSFDGRALRGLDGDTLASALLANGVRVVGRSLKYHRPRGIVGLGSEECNALVRVGRGAAAEPNSRATMVALREGLDACAQNAFPSLRLDFGAIMELFSPVIKAGFYYKTFKWPNGYWRRYEWVIRRAAGLGQAPVGPDPDRYEKGWAETELLVVGGGPAGLSAALAAGRRGEQVVLAEQNDFLGGILAHAPATIDGSSGQAWLGATHEELRSLPNVTILRSATVFGNYQGGLFAIAQRADPRALVSGWRERLWHVVAKRAVLATGAIERPLLFPGNDRPGIMLASATRGYLHRYGVAAGRKIAIATNNDSAYPLVAELAAAGLEIAAVVDVRTEVPRHARHHLEAAGVRLLRQHLVVGTRGRSGVRTVGVAPHDGGTPDPGRVKWIEVDHLAMSGGWTPSVHLHSQGGGRLRCDDGLDAFVPAGGSGLVTSVGGARATYGLAECIEEGHCAGMGDRPPDRVAPARAAVRPAREVPRSRPPAIPDRGKCFVDFQNDVTTADLQLAEAEGFRSVEHVKRYTTLGMGTDQGKIGNHNGLLVLAGLRSRSLGDLGVSTYRPPYTPVTIGTLVGRDLGAHAHPVRRTAAHDWHERNGAVMTNAGAWRRPLYYPADAEDMRTAMVREVSGTRRGVGLVDVSTLGKIEIQGPDSAEFLERVYFNRWKKLRIGRARYGLMLREDGMVFDDGITARLAEDHFLMTTTTTNAEAVSEWLEFLLQTCWPDLRVFATPVTEQWFSAALNGPQARSVLDRLAEFEVSDAALPHMSLCTGRVAGIDARVLRMSFSGELAYEINVPADFGHGLWHALLEKGHDFGIVPYGVESMSTMRIEKGHIVIGAEGDGRTTPLDLGFGGLASGRMDSIGQRSLRLSALSPCGRKQLVGAVAENPRDAFPIGGHVVAQPHLEPQASLGYLTSHTHSPELQRDIGLALLRNGSERHGERLHLVSPTAAVSVPILITGPCHVDPKGDRARI